MEETLLVEVPRSSDVERVFCWRFEALEQAGYKPGPALVLAASSHVDLHLALDLLRNGCPPDTALQILR